eukprot:968959-Pleurochrysis_carterae.AAC.1
MAAPARYPTDTTWLYKGGCDEGEEGCGECNMCARVGDKLIVDDVFGSVVLLGKTLDGSLTVRRRDGEI